MPDLNALFEKLDAKLRKIADVDYADQWGGRAYKLPGKDGSRKKPRLLAYVEHAKSGKHLSLEFKLPPEVGAAVISKHKWIDVHPWPNMGGSGWVQAKLTKATQIDCVASLVIEARKQFGEVKRPPKVPDEPASTVTTPLGRRIEEATRAAKADGKWRADRV